MSEQNKFLAGASIGLLQRATPRLKELLRERGVQELGELPEAEMKEVRRQALLQTFLTENPYADADNLRQLLVMLDDRRFLNAVTRVRREPPPQGAFDPASGLDAAVVLAGLGLPVCPFDRRTLGPIGEVTTDIEELTKRFANRRSAYVAYSPSTAPFYLVLTDCQRTLAEHAARHSALTPVRDRLTEALRNGGPLPDRLFQWGVLALPRMLGDKVPFTMIDDPRPNRGSVLLNAGWMEGNVEQGTPSRYVPMPAQFVQIAANDPFAMVVIRSRAHLDPKPAH